MKIAFAFSCIILSAGRASAQEKSVRPGINDPFKNPDLKKFVETFEGESREVFAKREQIAAAARLNPGMDVADVGAGTGLFSRIFASQVGPTGKVYAVDIAQKFLDHIDKLNKKAGVSNVKTVLCMLVSVSLPPASIDVAFICDTYHHFEYPARTMASIHQALKPGGRVVLVDFRRVAGESSDWVMNHVRAGQEVFEREILEAGFKKVREEKGFLKENYLVVFEKIESKTSGLVNPIIQGYGGVTAMPDALEQPTKKTKVVFDATAVDEAGKPVPGLARAAVLLNLAGATGLAASDVEIAVVLHGDATLAALSDDEFQAKTGRSHDSGVLIDRLLKAEVKVMVCGLSMVRKGLHRSDVRSGVAVAASAVTAVVNLQGKGYALITAH